MQTLASISHEVGCQITPNEKGITTSRAIGGFGKSNTDKTKSKHGQTSLSRHRSTDSPIVPFLSRTFKGKSVDISDLNKSAISNNNSASVLKRPVFDFSASTASELASDDNDDNGNDVNNNKNNKNNKNNNPDDNQQQQQNDAMDKIVSQVIGTTEENTNVANMTRARSNGRHLSQGLTPIDTGFDSNGNSDVHMHNSSVYASDIEIVVHSSDIGGNMTDSDHYLGDINNLNNSNSLDLDEDHKSHDDGLNSLTPSRLSMNKKILEKEKERQERRRRALMQQGENPFAFASIKGGGMTPSALSPFGLNINRNNFNFDSPNLGQLPPQLFVLFSFASLFCCVLFQMYTTCLLKLFLVCFSSVWQLLCLCWF